MERTQPCPHRPSSPLTSFPTIPDALTNVDWADFEPQVSNVQALVNTFLSNKENWTFKRIDEEWHCKHKTYHIDGYGPTPEDALNDMLDALPDYVVSLLHANVPITC